MGEGFITLFHTKSLACFDNIWSEPQKKDGHGHGHGWQEILSSSSSITSSNSNKMSNPCHMSMVVHRFTRFNCYRGVLHSFLLALFPSSNCNKVIDYFTTHEKKNQQQQKHSSACTRLQFTLDVNIAHVMLMQVPPPSPHSYILLLLWIRSLEWLYV